MGNLQGNSGLPGSGSQSGITQSVISPANITIKSGDATSQANAATLTSRDASTANGSLKNTLTLQQAQELQSKLKEQQENQRAAELVGAVVTNAIGDLAVKNKWAEGSDENKWADGSPQKLALHGIAGLIQAKVGGGNALAGISAGMAQEALAPVLASYLEANGIPRMLADGKTTNPDFTALMQAGAAMAGAAVGAVAQGTAGAATGASVALTGVTNNYLNHQQWNDLANALANCKAKPTGCSSTEEGAIRKTYADISAQQNAALATCTTNCEQLKKEVADGTDAMLLLIGQGKLPGITGATINDLGQNIGQNLANNSTLRAQVSNALAVKALCEQNPAQCDRQALAAAALVALPVLGYAGGAAALETLIATGRVAATELGLFNSMGPTAYCGMNPMTCLTLVEAGTGVASGAASPSVLPTVGSAATAAKNSVKSAGTVTAEVEVAAAKVVSASTVYEAGLPAGFKSFNVEGLPPGSRGVVDAVTGEVRVLTAAGMLADIPPAAIPANIRATVVPQSSTNIRFGGGIAEQGLPFEELPCEDLVGRFQAAREFQDV